MLKKSITYENFDGDMVTEDYYFHLSKADLIELEVSKEGGLQKWLETIVRANDGAQIMAEFKKIVLASVGQKSADGKRFIKTPEFREEFAASEAYSALFMEIVYDPSKAAEFVNGVVPHGLRDEVSKAARQQQRAHPSDTAATPAPRSDREAEADATALETGNVFQNERAKKLAEATPENPVELTRSDLIEIEDGLLRSGLADGRFKIA